MQGQVNSACSTEGSGHVLEQNIKMICKTMGDGC